MHGGGISPKPSFPWPISRPKMVQKLAASEYFDPSVNVVAVGGGFITGIRRLTSEARLRGGAERLRFGWPLVVMRIDPL